MTIIRKYNSLLPNYLDRFFGTDYEGLNSNYNTLRPAVNVIENNDNFVLELAAPGYDKKDFTINVENKQLTISAKKETKEENNYVMREFSFGSFERLFTLPETLEYDKIDASYKDGVLYVTLPKREEAKVKPPRMIEIK